LYSRAHVSSYKRGDINGRDIHTFTTQKQFLLCVHLSSTLGVEACQLGAHAVPTSCRLFDGRQYRITRMRMWPNVLGRKCIHMLARSTASVRVSSLCCHNHSLIAHKCMRAARTLTTTVCRRDEHFTDDPFCVCVYFIRCCSSIMGTKLLCTDLVDLFLPRSDNLFKFAAQHTHGADVHRPYTQLKPY
jgi:hypothetical protein